MRRVALIVLVALLGACGDDDEGVVDQPGGVIQRDRPVPAELQAFLDRVDPSLDFTATWSVLQRAGGTTASVTYDAGSITVDDLVVTLPATTEDDAALSAYGIFSTFWAEGPAAQIAATARRSDAGDPIFEERTVLGMTLDCVEVPVLGATASQWCLTPDGIFGWVSTPSVQYELTAYEVR